MRGTHGDARLRRDVEDERDDSTGALLDNLHQLRRGSRVPSACDDEGVGLERELANHLAADAPEDPERSEEGQSHEHKSRRESSGTDLEEPETK